MKSTLIPSTTFQPILWSGGITRELFIFPSEARYKERDFQFRLSSATVETEESEFTVLPGVSRKLMVLSGEITLLHQDHFTRKLSKFEVDSFEGDWKTTSVGRCTDFNLMTTGNTSGELYSMETSKGQSDLYDLKGDCDCLFVYVFMGTVSARIDNIDIFVQQGDLLVITKPEIRNLEIKGMENSELVFVEIRE